MQWYYSKNGTQLGPVPQGELVAKLNSGEVSATDLIWREGMGDWLPAAQVAELKGISAPGPAAVVSPDPASPYVAPASPYAAPASPGLLIPNYLWQSIAVTLLCCLPFGIVAIINAAKVDGLRAAGDVNGAQNASATAKKWVMYSLIGWVVAVVLYVIFIVAVGGIAAASGQAPR